MALEFQPPFQINPNAESHGERSLQRLGDTFSDIGNTAMKYGQQRTENKRQGQIMKWKQAEEDRAAQENQPLSDFMGPQPSASLEQGTTGPQSTPPPNTGYSPQTGQPMSMPIDHTSHFMNWKSMGMPASYDHADYGGTGQGIGTQQNPMQGFDPNTYARLPGTQRGAYLNMGKEGGTIALQQSEIAKNKAMAEMCGRGGPNSNKVEWKQNPFTGAWEPYPVSLPPAGGNGSPTPAPRSGGGRPSMFGGSANPGTGLPANIPFRDRAKLELEKPKALGSLQNTLREYDTMIQQAQSISKDPSLGFATGMAAPLGRIPATGAKRVASNLETLKAKTLLNVLSSLKELSQNGSSGFGALSNTEGENIRNSIASLDRSRSTEDFKTGLAQLAAEMQKRKEVLVSTYKNTYGEDPGLSGSQVQPDAGGQQFTHTATDANGQKVGWDGQKWVPMQ